MKAVTRKKRPEHEDRDRRVRGPSATAPRTGWCPRAAGAAATVGVGGRRRRHGGGVAEVDRRAGLERLAARGAGHDDVLRAGDARRSLDVEHRLGLESARRGREGLRHRRAVGGVGHRAAPGLGELLEHAAVALGALERHDLGADLGLASARRGPLLRARGLAGRSALDLGDGVAAVAEQDDAALALGAEGRRRRPGLPRRAPSRPWTRRLATSRCTFARSVVGATSTPDGRGERHHADLDVLRHGGEEVADGGAHGAPSRTRPSTRWCR